MKVKICGLRERENIQEVLLNCPDYSGFIFYPKSKRYVDKPLDEKLLQALSNQVHLVAVFVDESINTIVDICSKYSFDHVQLHGNESISYIKDLKENLDIKVIKAFGIDETFDFQKLKNYEEVVDCFLFDTKTILHGGSGRKFDWCLLDNYTGNIPFFLSGGIGEKNITSALELQHPRLIGYDINSQVEERPGYKDTQKVKSLLETIRKSKMKSINPDKEGFYGEFGGSFIPEMLYPNVFELQQEYLNIIQEESFQKEFRALLRDYVGRPTPLFYSKNLSKKYGGRIYLKREDLNHTGAHKINNTIGQILVAKRLGKKRIIAETGAGQHGVATATACALMGLECTIYMGAVDIDRQKPNVDRMKILGAHVVPAESGSKTLKDATNEAIRAWINNPKDTHYIIGSVVGPHPYPDMVSRFQSVISEEIRSQLLEKESTEYPDYIVACIGGGSNAIGAFYHFIDHSSTQLIAVEAGGEGVFSGKTAATIALGKKGIIHGSKTYLIQTEDGQIVEPHSISAGLDYPGIGPIHAYLHDTKLIDVVSITDMEAVEAALELCKLDGIIPALESAHALAYLSKMTIKDEDVVVVNLSGRGDKDMLTYQKYM